MNTVVQWMLNLAMLGGLVWFWFEHRKVARSRSHSDLQQNLEKLVLRIGSLETELESYRQKFEEKTKMLDSVCEQLNRALKNQKLSYSAFPLTAEESDLKEAMYLGFEKDDIPSVVQFESTKMRLKTESSLDLKTLLKGQLS